MAPEPLWVLKQASMRLGNASAICVNVSIREGDQEMSREALDEGLHLSCLALDRVFLATRPCLVKLRRRLLPASATSPQGPDQWGEV